MITTLSQGVIERARTPVRDASPPRTANPRSTFSSHLASGRVATPSVGRNFFHYLPENANSLATSPRVLGVGQSVVLPGECYPPLGHPNLYNYHWRAGRTLPEHQIIFLSDAAGEFESEATGRVRLVGDVVLFLFPGVWHRYRPLPGGGWKERWVSLYGNGLREQLTRAQLSPQNAVAVVENPRRLAAAFDGLFAAIRRGPLICGASAMPWAMQVVDEVVRQTSDWQVVTEDSIVGRYGETDEAEVSDEIVRKALEIIWNHQHNPPLGVSDVAKRLPVTRRTLDRKFSEALGRTVLDEINACRICRAKRLLTDTDAPIKAVAYLAGFPSRERLRLAFQHNEGMPPSEYREAARRDRAPDRNA